MIYKLTITLVSIFMNAITLHEGVECKTDTDNFSLQMSDIIPLINQFNVLQYLKL